MIPQVLDERARQALRETGDFRQSASDIWKSDS